MIDWHSRNSAQLNKISNELLTLPKVNQKLPPPTHTKKKKVKKEKDW